MEKPIKKRRPKNQKARPKPHPKNRYMRGSKLSEYKFLQILRGFADDKTAKELASEIRVSEKTIRATYRQLREKLLEAILIDKNAFGGAGYYLMRENKLGEKGKRFLAGVAESDLFAEHLERHLIRVRRPEDLHAHLDASIYPGLSHLRQESGPWGGFSVIPVSEFRPFNPLPGPRRHALARLPSWKT